MPQTIDLRKNRRHRQIRIQPQNELPKPEPQPLLETETATHPNRLINTAAADSVLLSWQALEFEPDPVRNLILLGIGGLLLLGAIAAFFFKSFIFAVLLLISGGLVASYAFRQPRRLNLAVTSRGIEIENRAYEFQDLKSFWIFYDPPLWKDLSLQSKKTFMPYIKIPLGGQDPLKLRQILLRFLAEIEHPETLTDIISKRLGF